MGDVVGWGEEESEGMQQREEGGRRLGSGREKQIKFKLRQKAMKYKSSAFNFSAATKFGLNKRKTTLFGFFFLVSFDANNFWNQQS